MDEHRVIRSYYNETGKTIPAATERRLDKQIAAFKQQWNIEQPEEPLSKMQTLDIAELRQPFQSWRDLMTAHNVVEHYYAVAGHSVPIETMKRQRVEVDDYEREVAAYKMSEDEQNNEVRTFQDQLKAAREQTNRHKPRPC